MWGFVFVIACEQHDETSSRRGMRKANGLTGVNPQNVKSMSFGKDLDSQLF